MYKKIRSTLWFARALLKKYRIQVAVGLLVGSVSFFVFPILVKNLPVFRPTQRIGIIGRYSASDLPLSIQRRISIGLATIGEDGKPSAGIASSWEVSEDGKQYTFSLNPDIMWHDGTQIISKDINYTFKDAQVEHPDETHLVMKLSDPFAALPTAVSRPVFKSTTGKLIGVGKYRVQHLKYNGSYLESITLVSPDTSLPVLKYSFYATQSLARTAYKLGLISSILDVTDVGDLSTWKNTNVRSDPAMDRYVAAFFNTESPNFLGLSGKNLRLAMAYAIDKSVYLKEERAIGPISPKSWAFNKDIKPYDFDVQHAKDLLKKVEKIPAEITITTLPAYLPTAEKLQKDWQQIGITAKIQVSQDIPEDFEVLIVAQAIPIDPDQYNLWHSTQTQTNLTGLKNPRIDKLLEDGRKTQNPAERKKIYADFQKYLVEESPAIFLYYPKTYSIFRK